MRIGRNKGRSAIVAGITAIAIGIFCLATVERWDKSLGSARLVSIQELPDVGEMCLPESDLIATAPEDNLFSALQERSVYAAAQDAGQTTEVTRHPALRYIRDLDPIYSYIAVDTRRNEVFMQDHNRFTIRVFNRLDNTPPNAARTEPKRIIGGPKTSIQFNT